MQALTPQDFAKFIAAFHASKLVEADMKIGLGSGSTAAFLVRCLGSLKKKGLRFAACATSHATMVLAQSVGIEISELDQLGRLDLTIDGADEFDAELNLIKGGGAALLREKIVATASDRMIVISDETKRVGVLGKFPLPVEVVRFGHASTAEKIRDGLRLHNGGVGPCHLVQRFQKEAPLITDEGHYLYDLQFDRIDELEAVSDLLLNIPGVVETGLFLGIADHALIGDWEGQVDIVSRSETPLGVSSLGSDEIEEMLKDIESI